MPPITPGATVAAAQVCGRGFVPDREPDVQKGMAQRPAGLGEQGPKAIRMEAEQWQCAVARQRRGLGGR